MTTNQIFLQATDLFYKNQYEKGLQKINQCLLLHPNNPTLIANRALFYSQMGHLQKAIQQLQSCISIDYQNYIPYFNLFSLKVRKNQLEQALKDLCCSLSCLYLTRARFRKRQQDTKQSIKYAKNNVEAHVLRALMLLEMKKIKQCINQLDWAYELNPNIPTLNKIRQIIDKKYGGISKQNKPITNQQQNANPRLISSYQKVQQDLMMQIKMKMTQFNGIYNDLNQQNGIVTHRVPRTLLPEQIQKLLLNNQFNQEIRQLYQLKYNAADSTQPVIYQMKEQYRIQNQLEFQQKLKQQDINSQNDGVLSNQDQEDQELNNDSLMDMVDQNDQQEISRIGQNQTSQLNQKNQEEIKSQKPEEEEQVSEGQFQQYLVVDEYPQFPIQQHSRSHIEPSFSTITQQKSNTYDYMQSSISSKDNQQIVNLYPMSKKKLYGRFKIQRLQITNQTIIQQFFQDSQQIDKSNASSKQLLSNRQLYCVCTYFKQKPGYKVTTCDKNILFNSQNKILECQWQQTFKQVQLIKQHAENVYIKIYSKNYNSYNDDLIGTGNNIVQRNGEIKVQIQSVYTGEVLGYLFLKLYLIDK